MAGRKVSAIKIKDLRYADVLSAAPTLSDVATGFKSASKIDNSHQQTFTYNEDEPSITQYKNDLTGKTYRSDVEAGDKRIDFVIGQYDFDTKAALQGGTSGERGVFSRWRVGAHDEQASAGDAPEPKDWFRVPEL